MRRGAGEARACRRTRRQRGRARERRQAGGVRTSSLSRARLRLRALARVDSLSAVSVSFRRSPSTRNLYELAAALFLVQKAAKTLDMGVLRLTLKRISLPSLSRILSVIGCCAGLLRGGAGREGGCEGGRAGDEPRAVDRRAAMNCRNARHRVSAQRGHSHVRGALGHLDCEGRWSTEASRG